MTNSSSLWYLENDKLYDRLCPHRMREHQSNHAFIHYGRNEAIECMKEGEMYLICRGKVMLGYLDQEGRTNLHTILKRGNLFGSKSNLEGSGMGDDFALSLEEDTAICKVDVDLLEKLIKSRMDLKLKATGFRGVRFWKIERSLGKLVYKSVRTRILEFITDFARTNGKNISDVLHLSNFPSHSDIAGLTAASPESVKSVLGELQELQIISVERNKILVPNYSVPFQHHLEHSQLGAVQG